MGILFIIKMFKKIALFFAGAVGAQSFAQN